MILDEEEKATERLVRFIKERAVNQRTPAAEHTHTNTHTHTNSSVRA